MAVHFFIVPLTSFASCSSDPVTFYNGPPRPLDEVARITTNYSISDDFKLSNRGLARLVEVDGQLSSSTWGYHAAWDASLDVQLLPGEHTLGVRYIGRQDNRAVESEGIQRFTFYAKKGHTYVLSATVVGLRWQAVLTDKTIGKQVHP